PMQSNGSTWMRPKGGWSSSGTQNMQSSTGQYSTQAGEPAHPVQHSVITASSFGFFFRGVASPFDFGSNFNSSGTIPTAFTAPGAAGMAGIIPRKSNGGVKTPPPVVVHPHTRTLVTVIVPVFVPPLPIFPLALRIQLVVVNIGLVPSIQPMPVRIVFRPIPIVIVLMG